MTADLTPQERVAALRAKMEQASELVGDCQARLKSSGSTLKAAAEMLVRVQSDQQQCQEALQLLAEINRELAALEEEVGITR